MVADIRMAFVVALLIRMFSLTSKYLKYVVVATTCLTLITSYFTHGCTIDFVGELDLAIWISFIILFDILLDFLEIGVKFVLKQTVNDHKNE